MPEGARRMRTRRALPNLARKALQALWPKEKMRWTREGGSYLTLWFLLLIVGWYQQINLILLVAGLAFGPISSSILISAASLRRLRVARRVPPYVFAGEPLALDYTLENSRRWTAALALGVEDEMVPVDRVVSGSD